MIHFVDGTKLKTKNISTVDELIERLQLDHIYNQEGLEKELRRYNDVYCYISPFATQIEEHKALDWYTSKEAAIDNYYRSADNV